jgi:hypothetical protein
MSGTKTVDGTFDFQIVKRSTLNIGGTSTTPPKVSMRSSNPASISTVRAYTTNPTTLGTIVGVLNSEKYYVSTAGNLGGRPSIVWLSQKSQPPTIMGSNELIALNFNATAVSMTGASFNITIEWRELPS